MKKDSVLVTVLPNADTIVIKKSSDSRVFILTDDSIIIGKDTLIMILRYLLLNNIINHKIIEGLLEEIHTE